MRKLANSIARDIASPAGKMGSRSLFPVVAVPRAFFGTFFRFERKYYPRRGGSPTVRAGVGASSSTRGKGYAPAGAPKGFPRGKQSARFALPCAPLVVCLNSGSLTAIGGCIHWIPASLRSPLETFGHRSWRETHRTASPNPHCSRRIMPPVGNFLRQSCCSPTQAGAFRSPPAPLRTVVVEILTE